MRSKMLIAIIAIALAALLSACEKTIVADNFTATLEIRNTKRTVNPGDDLVFSLTTNHPSLSVKSLSLDDRDRNAGVKVGGSDFEMGKVYQATSTLDNGYYRTDFTVSKMDFDETHSGMLRITVYDAQTGTSKSLEERYYSSVYVESMEWESSTTHE